MKFDKVTVTQYELDGLREFIPYSEIKLPKRATKYSAGYDIYSVRDFTLNPGESIKIPTGIKVKLDPDKFLMVVPRSGLGFKYGVRLANTVGIIDADYSSSDNEGHMWIKIDYPILDDNKKPMVIKQGDAICQGIILQYFKVDDDESDGVRNGGFGSTSKDVYEACDSINEGTFTCVNLNGNCQECMDKSKRGTDK